MIAAIGVLLRSLIGAWQTYVVLIVGLFAWLMDLIPWAAAAVTNEVLCGNLDPKDECSGGLAGLLAMMPAPGWLDAVPGYFSSLPSGVWWFLNMFNVSTGIAMIISALFIRFFIRRLPVIG